MKSRYAVLDHDLEYGRDIRIAGIFALVSVIAAFLFAPQSRVEPYRLHRAVEWDRVLPDLGPAVVELPKPPVPVQRGIPLASDNPTVPTIGPNTTFNELKPDVTAPRIDDAVIFWKVERKPRLIHEVKPDYPEMARAAGIEGSAVISMVVDALGNVTHAEVYASSGNTLLDQAAVGAAYQCRFIPGYQRDRPVTVRQLTMSFNFKLQ